MLFYTTLALLPLLIVIALVYIFMAGRRGRSTMTEHKARGVVGHTQRIRGRAEDDRA
jgi:hypothetical protein